MTSKKPGASRRYVVALCVVAVLVVALLAWWQWPVAGTSPKPVASASPAAAEAHSFAPTLDMPRNAANQHGWSRRDIAAAEGPLQTLCREQQQQRLTALRDRIPAAESPDAAITHALLTNLVTWQGVITSQSDFNAAGRELWNARKRWPGNLDLAWMSMQTCSPDFGCNQDQELRHLIEIDPDNAFVWMQVMQKQVVGSVAYDQALHRAATGKIYDTRFGSTFLHLQPVLATMPQPESCISAESRAQIEHDVGHPPTATEWADIEAITMEVATGGMGGYLALSRGCREDGQSSMPVSRRSDCMKLLARVANGDTLMDQALGLSLQIRLAGGGDGSAQLREPYRRMLWLHAQMPHLSSGNLIPRYMRDGEAATWEAIAKEQGLWPPPPDWLPDDPRNRSVILTGKVPPGLH